MDELLRPFGEQLKTLPGDEQPVRKGRVQEAETEGIIVFRDTDDLFQHDAGPQPFADHEGRIIGQVVRGADMQVSEGLFQPDSQPVCLIVILQDLIGYDEFFIPQVLRGDFFFL